MVYVKGRKHRYQSTGNDLRSRRRLPLLSPAGQAYFPGLADSPRFADFPG